MFYKIARYWRTIKYLKPVQIRFQFYYRFRGLFPESKKNVAPVVTHGGNPDLEFLAWIPAHSSYKNGSFSFLHKTKRFEEYINWNFSSYGKLWTYNLNYFDYLLQPEMNAEQGLDLIYDFIAHCERNEAGREPYPTSLRIINWIKFCLKFDIRDQSVQESMLLQLRKLTKNVEYHLMGNHLLENGCALLVGGIYFGDERILGKGKKIISTQLKEQILEDGGHFERSPMYHQIILSRLLDCYNLSTNSSFSDKDFTGLLKRKAELMMEWLTNITFSNGTVPQVNDTAKDIAPSGIQLLDYAKRLGLHRTDGTLGESGYRMIRENNYECFIDGGDIGPDYIPGHAHSDTLSFILHVHDTPLLVDTGVSTYEDGPRRMCERGTAAHNTVKVNCEEQTEVWKSFRVGRRAHIIERTSQENQFYAIHDGYKHRGVTHKRTFRWNSNSIYIKDEISNDLATEATAFFHFHPGIELHQQGELIIAGPAKLLFDGHRKLKIESYKMAMGFNRLKSALVVIVSFAGILETKIRL